MPEAHVIGNVILTEGIVIQARTVCEDQPEEFLGVSHFFIVADFSAFLLPSFDSWIQEQV